MRKVYLKHNEVVCEWNMAGREASRQQRGVSFEETWMIRREKENVDFWIENTETMDDLLEDIEWKVWWLTVEI